MNPIITLSIIVILVALPLAILSFAALVHTVRQFAARGKYRDYTFEPLDPSALRRATARWFERHTPDLESLGFHRIGDYRLQPDPVRFDVRFFAAPQRDVFATIEDYNGTQTVTMASVLEDGTYMETSIMRPLPRTVGAEPPLLFHYAPKATVAELHEQHLDHVRRAAEQQGTRPMQFDPDQATEIAQYGHRLLHWAMFEKGMTAEPPAPREPMLVA
ncbi:MAG TPA: hypothetical protein VJL29_08060 [Thermoguttaceae bacterium]|nr:hypothetical protein [Thermoguttaceae bacterium]